MVNLSLHSMTMAIATADDVTSLLQVMSHVRQSKGQQIFSAVAEGGKATICVEVAVGDLAPMAGSFTATTSQQTIEVAAGAVAAGDGSFCVPKQDALLMQRTFGLNTARDFEAALGSKQRKTTTTRDHEKFDFAGDTEKNVTVMVNQCPQASIGLMQAVDATVAEKQQKKLHDETADQARVCACRSFMTSSVSADLVGLDDILKPKIEELVADGHVDAQPAELLQTARDLDAALGMKQPKRKTTTTTTMQAELMTTELVTALTAACTRARQLNNWTVVAKLINDPDIVPLYANITEGWEHCDKSWVVRGACGPFTTTTTTTTESLGSRLTASYKAQNVIPQTANEAMVSGDWAEVGLEESRDCHPKFGRRFQKDGMTSPTVMYDNTGHIAGMQFAINSETFHLYPDSNLQAGDAVVSTGLAPTQGDYALTTYFSDPSKICSATVADHAAGSIGDRLWMANASAPGGYEAIPLNLDLGVPGGYLPGGCVPAGLAYPNAPGMGQHYWRTDAETPCNEVGPMFIMYSRGRLVAMGINFVGSGNQVPTNGNKRPKEIGKGRLAPNPEDEMWEFARQDFSPYFFKKEQNPKCMPNINQFDSSLEGGTATIATLHVFFSDPQLITCP